MGGEMRKLWILLLPLLLAGCSVPPAYQIASWALDGFSFIISGKSVSDHAISVVVQKDCAMWRIVQGDEICAESVPTEIEGVMVAKRPDIGDDGGEISQQELDEIGARLSEVAPAAGGERRVASAAAPALPSNLPFGTPLTLAENYVGHGPLPEVKQTLPAMTSAQPFGRPGLTYYAPSDKPVLGAVPRDDALSTATTNTSALVPARVVLRQLAALEVADDVTVAGEPGAYGRAALAAAVADGSRRLAAAAGNAKYLVLGSFRVRENAEKLSAGLSGFDTFVARAGVRGEVYHRVLARPSSGESVADLKRRYVEATGGESWVIALCRNGSFAPSCPSPAPSTVAASG